MLETVSNVDGGLSTFDAFLGENYVQGTLISRASGVCICTVLYGMYMPPLVKQRNTQFTHSHRTVICLPRLVGKLGRYVPAAHPG